jgi:hypothetical protein
MDRLSNRQKTNDHYDFHVFLRLHGRIPWCSSNLHRVGRGFPKGRISPFGLHEMVRVSKGQERLLVPLARGRWGSGESEVFLTMGL